MPFNGKTKWIMMLVSIVVALFCGGVGYSYTFIFPTLATNIIENDKASRDRDSKLRECYHSVQTDVIGRLVRIETLIEQQGKR